MGDKSAKITNRTSKKQSKKTRHTIHATYRNICSMCTWSVTPTLSTLFLGVVDGSCLLASYGVAVDMVCQVGRASSLWR